MKYLIVPENNSLSHIAKALAIHDGLRQRGHDVLIAVNRASAPFMEKTGTDYATIPDIQEQDGAGFPSVAWFRNDAAVCEVISQELRLLEDFRPDRVLGIFRFTLKAAAEIAGIPYDSLVCGCLLPGVCDAYGYAAGEDGERQQAELMSGFFRFAGARMSRIMGRFGLAGVDDAREMLLGERTFLWDFPDFLPARALPEGCVHVGPIAWDNWPDSESHLEELEPYQGRPLAILSFGTCVGKGSVAEYLMDLLAEMGFHVLLAAGGQAELMRETADKPWFSICGFAPLNRLWEKAALLVSHGGQMTLFEALANGIPVAVMPFQPEQAHNGVCLEALGCGRRLTPGQPFIGNSKIYENALLGRDKRELRDIFSALVSPQTRTCIETVNEQMRSYRGLPDLLPRLEGTL